MRLWFGKKCIASLVFDCHHHYDYVWFGNDAILDVRWHNSLDFTADCIYLNWTLVQRELFTLGIIERMLLHADYGYLTYTLMIWFLKCASTKYWYLDAAIWFACKILNLTFKCDQEWKQHACCMYRTRSYDNLLCFAKLLKDWWGNEVTLACMHHGFRLDSLIFCIWDAALNCNSTCESKDHALYYIMTLSRARHG